MVDDEFASLSGMWSQEAGSWSVSAGKLKVDSEPDPGEGPLALLISPAVVEAM